MTTRTDALAAQLLSLPVDAVELDIDAAAWSALEGRFGGVVHPALRRVLSDCTFTDRLPFRIWLPKSWQRLSEFSPGRVETPDFVIIGEKHDDRVPTGSVYGVEWSSLVDTGAPLWTWTQGGAPRVMAAHLLEHAAVANAMTRIWLRRR
ncbi:MAG: hypothetical protein GQE15_05295 [Archangiaceae bacterium]|nr:hypothetical protein [Archangiaceae bacterium]